METSVQQFPDLNLSLSALRDQCELCRLGHLELRRGHVDLAQLSRRLSQVELRSLYLLRHLVQSPAELHEVQARARELDRHLAAARGRQLSQSGSPAS